MARTKKVNLKDVASKAGVSPTTASVILNGRWEDLRIAVSTRNAVVAIAKEMGYESTRASSKTPGAASLWCVFTPVTLDAAPTAEFLRGLREYVAEHRLDVETIIFPFDRGHLQAQARWITPKFSSGLVMAGLNDADVAFLESTDFDVPIVLFNRATTKSSAINIDDYGVGQIAMRQFTKRRRSRIATISPAFGSRHLSLRIVGLTDELRSSQGTDVPDPRHEQDDGSTEGGHAAMDRLLATGVPDAVFILNDAMTAGVLHRLEEAGLDVPGDVDVISFGNAPVNTLMKPSLTSIELPIHQMGHDCAMLLHQASMKPEVMESISRVFDADIVYRESSPKE